MRSRPPRPCALNAVWGVDLTGKQDVYGETHAILGMVDHGSRLAISLKAIRVVNAWTLLGSLFMAIGEYGKPKAIRTDNATPYNPHDEQSVQAAWAGAIKTHGGGVAALVAEVKRQRGQRGKQAIPTKEKVAIRFDQDVVAAMRASGDGWQTRLNDLARKVFVQRKLVNAKRVS